MCYGFVIRSGPFSEHLSYTSSPFLVLHAPIAPLGYGGDATCGLLGLEQLE